MKPSQRRRAIEHRKRLAAEKQVMEVFHSAGNASTKNYRNNVDSMRSGTVASIIWPTGTQFYPGSKKGHGRPRNPNRKLSRAEIEEEEKVVEEMRRIGEERQKKSKELLLREAEKTTFTIDRDVRP